MRERGRVETVSGNIVTVRQEQGINCFGCMNHECKQKQGIITAVNTTGKSLAPGQLVETLIPGPSLFAQILGALAPPVSGFALFFIVSGLLFPSLPENARAALGVLGLFCCAGGICLFRGKHPAKPGAEVAEVLD